MWRESRRGKLGRSIFKGNSRNGTKIALRGHRHQVAAKRAGEVLRKRVKRISVASWAR